MPALSDDRLRALLDELTPPVEQQSQWQAIVAEAEVNSSSANPLLRHLFGKGQRRTATVAIAAILILVIAPLSALAVTQGWWFFRSGRAPQPISPVVIVAHGVWNGAPWEVTAYRSTTDGICTALTTRPGERNGMQGAMGCAQITGVPVTTQTKSSRPLGITWMSGERSKNFPAYVVGPVVGSAKIVVLTLDDRRRLRVTTIAAPPALGANVRFFISRLPNHLRWTPGAISPLSSLTGLDGKGRIVAHLAIPPHRLPRPAFRVSNNGGRLPLSAAFKHALRLAHRSTLIYELGTRDGQNFYRLGGRDVSLGVAHSCWGVGRAVNAATLPATRRGIARLVGVIECNPKSATSFPSPEAPVFDLSIWGANRGQKKLTLYRLSGFASDAVKNVNLIDSHGHIVKRIPVIGNVYALARPPKGVVAVVPTSFSGVALARCGPNHTVRSGGGYLAVHC